MAARFARRLFTLLLAGLLGALLVRLAPGFGIDEREMDTRFNADTIQRLRNTSAAQQNILYFYGAYLRDAVTGDLGYSRLLDRPVRELVKERLPVTFESVGLGWLAGVTLGLALAMVTALIANPAIETLSVALSGAPLILPAGLAGLLLYFAGLPVAAGIAAVVFPKIYFYVRNLIADGMKLPHVVASRARGISSLRILCIHVLLPSRHALLALSSVTLTAALGAAIPMEVVCDSPGIGQLAWRAALGRDMVLLTGLTLFIALVTIAASSLADFSSERLEAVAE